MFASEFVYALWLDPFLIIEGHKLSLRDIHKARATLAPIYIIIMRSVGGYWSVGMRRPKDILFALVAFS